MRRIVSIGLTIAIGSALLSRGAAVQSDVGVRLRWDAPPDCASAEEFRMGVEQILGKSWSVLEPRLDLLAQISGTANHWRLTLQVRSDEEVPRIRSIEGESCKALVAAGAAIVALMIEHEKPTPQPDLLPPAPPPNEPAPFEASNLPDAPSAPVALDMHDAPNASTPTRTTAEMPSASPQALPASQLPVKATPHRSGSLDAELLIDGWSLPKPTLGARVVGNVVRYPWQVGVGFFGLLPATTELRAGANANLWLVAGQLRGCHQTKSGSGRMALATCATFDGGWMHGSTNGLVDDGRRGTLWLALGPELGLRIVFAGSHRLALVIATPFPLLRQQFVVGTSGQNVHDIPPVTLRVGLGYGFDFG